MAQNEPITIARWEDIQNIGEVAHTQHTAYHNEGGTHSESHNHYTYHFLTKNNDILDVNLPLYTEYFNTHRYDHLHSQSLQYLTQLQAGSPVSIGNVTLMLSGISTKGLSYAWNETNSIFLNMQSNTLDIFFHIPSSPTPTVVKRRPERLTITLQGDIDLFEKLLYYAIRPTPIFYALNGPPIWPKDSHARYQHIWPPGQKISPYYRKESVQ